MKKLFFFALPFLSLFSVKSTTAQIKGPAGVVDSIQLWLDGSDVNNSPGTNPADGTRVAVWKDISGKSHDAYVLSGQDTAKMSSNQINGKDVIRFTGISGAHGSVYEVPTVDIRATTMPKATIFTVYRPAAPTGFIQGVWGADNGSWDRFFMPSFGAADGVVAVGAPTNYVSVPGAGTAGETKLLTAVYHSGATDSSVIYFNALPISRVTDNTNPTNAQTTLRIGWDGDDNPFTGDVAEMVVYNRKLSECEIKAVNRYFGYKYGVTFTSATVTPSVQQYFCSGDTVSLKGGGGGTYQWLKDGAPIASATDSIYKATAAGSYAVIATSGGCSDTSVATAVSLVPATIFVDSSKAVSGDGSSWANAKKTLGEALTMANAVSCPVQIWVRKGTYYPSGTSRDSSFRIYRNNIKVYGGFNGTESALSARSIAANPTILSGDIGVAGDSTDNTYHVVTIVGTPSKKIDTNTVVDGFFITHGNANGSGSFSGNSIGFYRTDGGGMICVGMTSGNQCNPLIENCTFQNNAGVFGAGFYHGAHGGGTSNPVLRSCTFEYNSSSNQGGAFHSWGDGTSPSLAATFTNCIFRYNKSVSHGGAGSIRASSAAPAMATVFSHCTFTGNTATGNNGGAINFEGNNIAGPTFDSCIFDANLSNFGGAVHVGNVSSSFFINCLVRNNRSTYAGGGIIITNGISSFTGCSFSGNFADGFGGAICNPFSGSRTMSIKRCTFTGNTTNSNGAGIYLQDGITANIDSSVFSGNRGTYGGALCLYTAAPAFNISNSVFSNDTANYGSVVRGLSAGASSFSNCRFESNYALTQGGVENAGNGSMILTRCVFANNRAGTNAAGFLSWGTSSTSTLDNCIFSGNFTTGTGGGGGGAIDLQQGTVTLNNTTLSGNSTASTTQPNSGGIWVEAATAITLNNSIVWGAAAQQISVAGTATYNYSLVKGLALAAPSLSSNPQFVNAADADGADNTWGTSDDGLRLTPCSPCLNTGSNSLVPGGMSTDYALATRIQDVTVDMGAYEHAFAAQGLPDVTISASTNPACSGETITFSRIETWPGSSTGYTWYRNGTAVATTAAFSSSTLAYGDTVWLVMTNNDCALSDTSNRIVMLINSGRLYVDGSVAASGTGTSWASPFKTVSEALSLANTTPATCATEIWVKKGTYYPTTNTARDSSFRITRNNIKLYGGFAGGETLLSARSVTANPTILSGDIGTANDSTDNSYHVMTILAKSTAQIDTNTVVDGFTITRGNAQSGGSFTYNGITFNRQDGGGIQIWGAGGGNKCTPLIAHCTFTRNTANYGGGIYSAGFSGGDCSPVFRNNTFSSNKANALGGGLFNNGQNSGKSSATIDSCIFSNNTAQYGGGLYNQALSSGISNGPVSNCTFSNNKATADGGGFHNAFGNPVISNCRFIQNDASLSGGAFFQQGGKSSFLLNVFEQNTAPVAGAIRLYTGDPSITLQRNVFYRNTSSVNDAGAVSLVSGAGTDTVINNLFVQNKNTGSGPNGGGAMVQEAGTSSYIINNTFYADTATSSGGALHFKAGGTNRYLINNIFYKNYNGSSVSDYNTASGTSVTVESNNLFSSTNPRFARESNPIGADGTWLTADDGLDLLPCSPAVNAGTTAPPADIRNRARLGLPDIGAYEEQGKPLPSAPVATSPVSYCQNATSVALTASRSSASDTLKWYDSVPALLPGAPTPSTATAGTFTWSVSQTDSTGCESAKTTITVIIKPTPVVPVATTPVVYCQGVSAAALSATLAAGSDTLKWYDASMTALPGAPTPSTATPGTYTYYVSQKTALNCEGPKTAITVQVNPTPGLPSTTTPVIYCQGAPAVPLAATATSASDTLKWYNSVPALLSAAPTPSTLTAGTFTFYVSQKNNFSCEGAKKAITVQVNPTPVAPPSASPVTYCQDDVATTLTATKASSSDTLKWYDASMSPLAAAPVPSTVSAGTTTYYVSAKTALGCEGPKTTITVVVNPRPAAPAVVTPINLCVGVAPAPLTATGTNLKWYTAASGGTGTPSLVPAVSTVGTNTYYVTQTNTFGCESPRASLTVNVRPSPVVTVTPVGMPAFVFCVGDSIAIKATSATAISYEWKINSSTIPGSVSDTLHIDTTSTYSVIVKDLYGCADTESVYVMKNPLPKPKLSPVDVTICKGVSIILYGSPATPGYKYEWFKDGVLMGIDTTKDHITVDTTGYYMVRMTDIYTCTVNSNESNISQYPEMIKPTIVRTGSVLKLSASYAAYQWYRNGKVIAGATSKTYTLAFDGDYHVVVLDANGCEGTSDVIRVHALGIGQAQAQGGIRVYPNPSRGKVIIDAGTRVNVIVTDITGRELLRAQQTTEIDLEPFADGIYMLRIFDQEGRLLQNERINKQTE